MRSVAQWQRIHEVKKIEGYFLKFLIKKGFFNSPGGIDVRQNPNEYDIDIQRYIQNEWRNYADIKAGSSIFINRKEGEKSQNQNQFYLVKESQLLDYEQKVKGGQKYLNYWFFHIFDLGICEWRNEQQQYWDKVYNPINDFDIIDNSNREIIFLKQEISCFMVGVNEIIDQYRNHKNLWQRLPIKEKHRHHMTDSEDKTGILKFSRNNLHGQLIDLQDIWDRAPTHMKEDILTFLRKEMY